MEMGLHSAAFSNPDWPHAVEEFNTVRSTLLRNKNDSQNNKNECQQFYFTDYRYDDQSASKERPVQ